jgi:ADP-L-glycero-D-manno-heptose 6-epimerase
MKMYDDQLIVVTGGAGFIGSNLIRHLNNNGTSNIVVVDELGTDEKWKNLVGKKFVDIIEKQYFFDWLRGREREIEAFIHLGACSDTTEQNASFLLENNYRFSVRLAEYALKNNHRFIYASSAATYGDGSLGFSDDHDTLRELHPMNMYGYSKHLFDLWVQNQGVINQVVGLKYFNVFGPNEWHKGRMASVVHHILPKAQREGIIRLFKSSEPEKFPDGGQQRDFIYVKDAARMTAQFLENDACGIYNIGRGIPETWNALATAVFDSIEVPANIEYFAMPDDLVGKYQNYTCADVDKVKHVLGHAADCEPLAESVKDYVQNHLMVEKSW